VYKQKNKEIKKKKEKQERKKILALAEGSFITA